MQIFTTNYSTKAMLSLTGLLSNLKNFISLAKPARHVGVLRESPMYVSGKSTIALMALCVFMGFTSSVFGQADFTVTPATKAAVPNEVFNLTVVISTSEAANGGEVHMTFDKNILKVNSITTTGPFFNLLLPPLFDNTNGTIDYAAGISNFGVPVDGAFDFLIIEVEAIGNGIGVFDFNGIKPSKITSGVSAGTVILDSATGAEITVASANEPPVADFTINPTTASTNEIVTFDGSFSMDNDGTVDSYAWDFGDGTTQDASANSSTTHSYTVVGQYQVALTVTDDLGAMNTTTKMIMVNAPTVNQFTVNSSSNGNGIIAPAGAVSVSEGGDQLFTFTPDAGFEVSEVLVGGVPVLPVPTASYTLLSVSAPETISVSFSEIPTGPFQLCIASGSGDLTAFGRSFVGDPGNPSPTGLGFTRTGGLLFAGYNGAIADAAAGDETTLYQKEIYGGKTVGNGQNPPFIYKIPVANGTYQVDLYFAEVFHPSSGGRIFDVFLEDNLMLDEYDLVDPIKDGLSTNQTAIVRTYNVAVTDGELSLQIGPASVDNGKLSGICVTEAPGANLHPVTAIGDLTYEALVAVADPLNIVDPENDELSIVFNGLPASLSYDPITNQIQGTPLALEANTYTINAIISDGINSPVTEEFTLVINPVVGDNPPTIDAIADVEVNEGEAISQAILVTDDNLPAATIELFDVSDGGTNNPFTPTTAVVAPTFTLVDNSGGSYTFNWTPSAGRSYLARVTADDEVNPPVIKEFRINVAQQLPGTIFARTFTNPVPWYGSSTPDASNGYSVAIETSPAKNIGYIDNGDFVEYVINVPTAGVYDLEVFAGKGNGGTTVVTFSEENSGGFAAIGSINVIQTGWQNFASYKTQVTFTNAGVQTLRFDFNGGANIRDFNFTSPNNTSPIIDAIADVQVNEGEAISQAILVTDDNLPAATIELFDVSAGGTNNPFTPTTAVAVGTLVDNSAGSYTFNWTPTAGSGRSYLARVTANDGTNSPVIEEFRIDVAQQLPGTILARTFNNPVPWYGGSPEAGFTVAIENAGNIGWTGAGEFVEYLINVPTPGSYNVRFSSSNGSGSASNISILEEGNATPIGMVNVPSNGWNPFNDYNVTVALANSGLQTLRLEFDGGVNTNEFEFTLSTNNTAPVVTITSPEDNIVAESDFSINFTGTALDAQDGDLATSIVWRSDLDGALGSGANINATLTEGTHVITAEVSDLDGTPLMGSATVSLIIVSPSPVCDTRFRVNAGGPMVNSATVDYKEDQATSLVGGTAQTGTPSIYVNTASPAVDKTFGAIGSLTNTTGYPDFLFQTERYSDVANPDNMNWSFPIEDGIYDVKILFNENWTGEINEPRVFDVEIEGNLALDDYRPSGSAGADVNVAKVEIYQATVTDGELNINFIKGTQNPSVKGFDICFVSDLPTDTPPVVAISSPTNNTTPISIDRLDSTTFTASVVDAEDDNTTLTNELIWTIDPIEPNFTGTGGTFDKTLFVPGVYTIRATTTDSDTNTAFDEIEVTVLGPDVNFTSPAENADLATTNVQVTWSATNMDFGGTTPEHFHLWVNPSDPSNLIAGDRISTASFPGQLFWDLTAADGIVQGPNKVIIIAADNGHLEFLNSEARDEVNFNVLGDTTNPIAVCQDITVQLDATGSVTITADDVDGGSSDIEGIASLAIDVESFTGANLGPNTVTLTVTDTNNNTATCTATVTVEDNLAPVAVCTDFTLQLDANGVGSLTAANVDGGSTDNDVIDTISIDTSDFDVNNVGANTVTLTVTDASGNSATCTAVVVVEDNIAPTAICQNIEVALDANGLATITAADIDNGSNDASGIASLSVGTSSFDCDDIGDNTVMMTVVDNNGNTATCMATVTVIDDTPPVLVDCPGNRFITSPTAQILELTPPTAIDACGVNTVVGTRSDGLDLTDAYQVGTVTTVTWMATDNNGVVGTCQTIVTITAPVSSGKEITGFDVAGQVGNESIDSGAGTIALTVSTGTPVTALAPTIAISNAANISPASGAVRDFSNPQTYTVTAEDATTKEWTVTIGVAPDTEAPVVTCPDTIIVANDPGECGAVVTFDDATATDNVGVVSLSYSVPNGSVFDVGTTTVMVTATDAAGLTASCSFDVTVNDMEAPIVSCLGNQTEQGDINGDFAMPDYTGLASALDNCDGSTLLTQNPLPGTVISGTTLVTITSEDTEGNSGSCTFDVTVLPETLSSLTIVPSAITVNLIQGETAMRDYVVNSDNASTLPTPAAMSIIDNATNNPATWASTTSAANQGTSYEVNVDATGLAPGTYNATLTAGPVTGYTNASIPVTLIVAPAVGNGALIVLDATTDTPLFDLTDGLQISKATIGNTPLGIIFNSSLNPGGVVFSLSGPIIENRTEGPAPHSLFGDIGVNIQGKPFPVGNYTLVANPNVGPTITVNFTVTDVNPLCVNFDASLSGITNPSSCSGVGSATAVPSGGVAPFTYQWSNGGTSASVNNLSVGPHSVIVRDANGCSKTLTLNITGPSLPVVTLAPFANVLNTAPAFALTGGSPAGGTYTGAGVTNNMFNPASVGVGTYAVLYSYTDANGCANSATRNITVTTETSNSALIVLDATDDSELFALTNGLQISKATIGNTPLGIIFNSSLNPGGVVFSLSGPITENRTEGPAPHSLFGDIGVNIQGKPFPVGNYTLVANPNVGPTITVNFTVTDVNPLCVNFDASLSGITNPSSCSGVGSATAVPSGGVAPFTYQWSNGGTSASVNNLSVGPHSVIVRDANGCSKTLTLNITGPSLPVVTLAPFANVLNTAPAFALTGGSPAGGTYTGAGVTNNMFNPASVGVGTYAVLYSYTDANGCANSATRNITVTTETSNSALIVLDATDDSELFALTDGLQIDKSAIGNTPLGIIFNTNLNPGGVQFRLTGPITEIRTEGASAPYSLFGDIGVNIQGKPFPVGNYTLVANPNAGPTITVNFSVVNGPLGNQPSLAARTQLNEMSIAPNPANVAVTLSFDEPILVEEILIFDVTGRLIKTIREPLGLDSKAIDFNVIDLPTGTYFIKTMDSKGTQYQEQMLIERY